MLDNSKARKVVGIFVEPVAKFLLKLGLTPNSVTLIGTAGISVSALVFFPRGEFFVGTLVILLFVFSDLSCLVLYHDKSLFLTVTELAVNVLT